MARRLIRKIPHRSVETRDDPFDASAFGGEETAMVERERGRYLIYLPVMP